MDLLNKWTDLATVTTRSIDDGEPPDLDKVWNDPYAQVRLDLYGMRSKYVENFLYRSLTFHCFCDPN